MNKIKSGDIKLIPTVDGGDLHFVGGQPEIDDGIETAIYISLFSDGGFWANSISDIAEQLDSEVNAITARGTLTNKFRLDLIEAAKNALQWLLDENVCEEIDVNAFIKNSSIIILTILLVQPSGDVELKYEINWKNQIENLRG